MKIRISVKDPNIMDSFEYATENVPETERDVARQILLKYTRSLEYVTLVIDTETRKISLEPAY